MFIYKYQVRDRQKDFFLTGIFEESCIGHELFKKEMRNHRIKNIVA